MPWRISGQLHEFCSCKMFCPCWLGPAVPDQGWCSGFWAFDIQEGSSDGVNLGGAKVGWVVDLPGDFAGGNGTARLYLDDATTADQRRELEAIFSGKKGGHWGALMDAVVTRWVPSQVTPIQIQWGDAPSITVGDAGTVTSQRVTDGAGHPTTVHGTAAATGALNIERIDLFRSDGSYWSDPEMRRWESGGSGVVSTFDWSA